MIVLGCDQSLSSTGLVLYSGDLKAVADFQLVKTGPGRTDDRIRVITEAIVEMASHAELVVMEEPILHSPSSLPLAGLAYVLRYRLDSWEIPWRSESNTEVKKWATGNGRADKLEIILAAQAAGFPTASHDLADAFHLARFALAHDVSSL